MTSSFSRVALSVILGCALLAAAPPLVSATEVPCGGTGRGVQAEIDVAAPPEAVLEAFTQVEAMQVWWHVQRGHVAAHPGGFWALTWDVPQPEFGFVVLSGIIESFRPGEHLSIKNLLYFNRQRPVLGPMTLTIEVRKAEDLSHLVVCQDGYGYGEDWDWYYELVRKNWPPALVAAKAFLEAEER